MTRMLLLAVLALLCACPGDGTPEGADMFALPDLRLPDAPEAPDLLGDLVDPDVSLPDQATAQDMPWPDQMLWWTDVGMWPDVGTPKDFPPVLRTEKVTCSFIGSTSPQQCYASTGAGCTGTSTCSNKVSGGVGTVLWKSTCGGSGSTVMDGKDETVTFTCP